MPSSVDPVRIDLSSPPEVVQQGRALHGEATAMERFQLPSLWQLHLYDYAGELELDGRTYPIAPGSASLCPPGSEVTFRYRGLSRHLYAHLRAPVRRRDHEPVQIPVMQALGAELTMITSWMTSAVSWATSRPERTRSDLWSVLWTLADIGAAERNRREHLPDDHVRVAMAYIEQHLSEPVTVPRIAAAVGLSQGHLTRLFRYEAGRTVIGYLRQRRVDHARHLLRSSTMSVAAVAASVGIPDLQAFNKTCRAVTGLSPRQLRETPAP